MPWASASESKPIKGLHLAIAAGCILVVGTMVWLFTWLFGSLNNELASSRQVSEKVVAAVSADWGRTTFDALATPEFVAAHAKGKYDSTRYLTLLGALKTSGVCGTQGMSITNAVGWSLWSCPATFEGGEGTLVINLALKDGKWLLSDFAVQI